MNEKAKTYNDLLLDLEELIEKFRDRLDEDQIWMAFEESFEDAFDYFDDVDGDDWDEYDV